MPPVSQRAESSKEGEARRERERERERERDGDWEMQGVKMTLLENNNSNP